MRRLASEDVRHSTQQLNKLITSHSISQPEKMFILHKIILDHIKSSPDLTSKKLRLKKL